MQENLKAGQELTIEFKGKKLKSYLRGWDLYGGKYLLIEPPHESLPPDLKPGASMVIRFQSEGVAYGLMVVLKKALIKTNLWVLRISQDIVETRIRSGDRFDCLIPATIMDDSETNPADLGKGMINDISLQGIRLITRKQLYVSKMDVIDLSFYVGLAGMIERQKMQVVKIGRKGKMFEYSGPFVDMDFTTEEKLHKFFEFCREWVLV